MEGDSLKLREIEGCSDGGKDSGRVVIASEEEDMISNFLLQQNVCIMYLYTQLVELRQ